MSSSTLYKILCTIVYFKFQINHVLSQITKSVALRPNSTISNISVTLGPGASVIGNIWNINVNTQQGTDLHIQLGSDWGFNPTYTSTISLFIHGSTSNQTFSTDGEIIFIFNVNDKYFAQLKSLEINNNNPYKQCPNINTPLIIANITQIITPSTPDRYDRYCTTTWQNTGGITYKDPVKWPMYMDLQNDPNNNLITYQWGDYQGITWPPKFSNIQFTSSFPPNEGLNIHISGDKMNENFNISKIDVTYSYIATPAPSLHPTVYPTTSEPTTAMPTSAMPTYIPTIYPTTIPTVPSNVPTINPTNIPTYLPTIYPTHMPSNIPTYMPSIFPTLNPVTTYHPTLSPTLIPTHNPSVYSIRPTTVVEVKDTSDSPITSIWDNTMASNDNQEVRKEDETVIQLSLIMAFVLIGSLLLFGICCFTVGICFGVTFYKKKFNPNDEQNESNKSNKLIKESSIEKRLSTLMTDDKMNSDEIKKPKNDHETDDKMNLNKINYHETDDEDHESLYASEIFDANSVNAPTTGSPGQQQPKRKGHHIVESDSMQIPPIPKQTAGSGGEVDNILVVNGIELQSEHEHNDKKQQHNPPPVAMPLNYNNNRKDSMSLQVPKRKNNKSKVKHQVAEQQKYKLHKINNNLSDNASVSYNYTDADIDEKENRITQKKPTIGNTKAYGIRQPDIFPDDEGVSDQRYNEKSVGYNSLRDIEQDLNEDHDNEESDDTEHYNSDPNEDEDEKYVQNEATLGIEIEMQTRRKNDDMSVIQPQNREEEAHFRMLKKVMLDESSMGDDEFIDEDDDIGPLPGSNNISIRYSKSGQHLASMIIPSINKSYKRKSQSEISSSHRSHKTNKSGNTFITLFQEQKDNVMDDLDDDGLDDPEYEQEIQYKMEQNQRIKNNGGY